MKINPDIPTITNKIVRSKTKTMLILDTLSMQRLLSYPCNSDCTIDGDSVKAGAGWGGKWELIGKSRVGWGNEGVGVARGLETWIWSSSLASPSVLPRRGNTTGLYLRTRNLMILYFL